MTETTIRKLTGLEMKRAFYDLSVYAFRATPPMPELDKYIETFRESPDRHCWAVFEDGRPAAVLGYTSMVQNVRGKRMPMGGVWGVAAAPETRRKGYVRQAMAAAFAEMREVGMPVSGLYPFRESFYERLGYVTFTFPRQARFPVAALASLLKQDLGGTVERVPSGEGIEIYRAYLEAMRARVHGMAYNDAELPERLKDDHTWMLIVRENGQVTGLMRYRISEEARWKKVLEAERFYYITPLARARLLEWIARHTDQVETADIYLPPWEHPEYWLVDLKTKMEMRLEHGPMGRVIDVTGLNGIPCGAGSFSARITDPYAAWNAGSWRFESVDGALTVERVAFAECELPVQSLSAWLYGNLDPLEFAARGWGSPSPEMMESMRSMLPTQPSYMHAFY